jgi:hypothetical protein
MAATTRIDQSVTSAASVLSDSATAQGDAARNMLDRQLEALRFDANRHIEAAVMRLDNQLSHANATVAEAAAVAVPARAAIAKIDSALPFYTDCDAGMCLANILYGVGKESEKTLRSIDKTMQVIAAKSPPVADSLEKSAAAMEIRSRQSIFRNLFFNLKSPAK